jgi:imidazolonepropionase
VNPSSGIVLIRGARQLLTLRGPKEPRRGPALEELGVICDGSVLIRDGILEEVGPTRRVENLALARDAREIDATGRVVMPGFIDSHTHLLFPFALSAGGEEDADMVAGNMQAVSGRRLELKAHVYVDAMVRHGTTTFEAKTGCGLDEAAEAKVLRVLATLDGDPIGVVPTFLARFDEKRPESAESAAAYIEWVCSDLMVRIRKRQIARFADIYWAAGRLTQAAAQRFVAAAHALGLALKVHDETPCEPGGARLAVESGAVSVDHLDYASDHDRAMLAASGTMATLLPAASFHSGERRYAAGRALIDAGAAVALGTNFNPVATPALSMQAVISLACSRLHLTPEEAVTAATINAAHALRCAGRVGSLEYGKSADLLILDTADYRDLAYHFGHNLVATTIKRGEVVYSQGIVERRENAGMTRAV